MIGRPPAGRVSGPRARTANARVRIPAVAGQSYYLHVYGATAGAVVNGYNATIINTPPPVPYDLELSRSVLAVTDHWWRQRLYVRANGHLHAAAAARERLEPLKSPVV